MSITELLVYYTILLNSQVILTKKKNISPDTKKLLLFVLLKINTLKSKRLGLNNEIKYYLVGLDLYSTMLYLVGSNLKEMVDILNQELDIIINNKKSKFTANLVMPIREVMNLR